MNPEQMENTIRRLGVLQEKKTELVDKYEEVIQNSPLVINEEGQPQLTKHIAMIALSTDPMKPDDTQAGGYSIVPLDRSSPLLFGYHNGKNTGTVLFCLKAVRKIMKSTPKDESLTIITRNDVVADYLKGENTIDSRNKIFPYVAGCIEDIEKMFAERTAPVYGYWMKPGQDVDWLTAFSELARKVASESRKLCLVTDDDRQWDAAHPLSASLPPSPAQQVSQQQHPQQDPQIAQASLPPSSQQDAQSSQALPPPSSSQQQLSQQDAQSSQALPPPSSSQQQLSQQDAQSAQELPPPSSQQVPQEHAQPTQVLPPPTSQQQLTPLAEEITGSLQSLGKVQKKRLQAMKETGGNIGVVCNRDIRLHSQRSPDDRNHIAFLSMSNDIPRSNGHQFGGYSVIWVDANSTPIEYNYYDNPVPGAVFFLLLGLRDALNTCPLDEPLLVATTNHGVVNYVNQKKLAKRNAHMEPCLNEIDHIMQNRTAPTISFLIGQYPRYPWMKEFYGLARHIASEARRLGLERNFEPLPPKFSKVVSDLVPAGSSLEQQSQQPQQSKRTEQAGKSSVEKPGKRSEKQANYNTKSIIQNLRALETRRMELLESPHKVIKVGNRIINLDQHLPGGKPIRVAIIAMSTDIPRQNTGCQAGGFGAIWLNKKSGNQFGNYDSPGAGTLIFLLKAVQEVLVECPLDHPLIIASTNRAIENFINGGNKPSQEIHEVDICLAEITDQLRKRRASTESILLDKESLRESWIKDLYDLSRRVASEARKLWFAYSEEEKVSLAPSRFEESKASSSSSISPPTSQKRARQDPVQMPPRPASSSITHPDELHKSLINQTNQLSLEGIHPSRAAAIGLVNALPFSTSVVKSSDSNGVHIDRDQVYVPWPQGVQSMNTMPPPSQLPNTATTAYYPLPVSPAMVHSSSMTEPQAAGYGQYYQDTLSTSGYTHGYPRSFDTSSLVTGQPTTSMSAPMTSVSIQHGHQDKQYKNKRSIQQEEEENEGNKRQRIDSSERSKSEGGGGIISRIWDNPVGKWVNRMFGGS